MSKEFKRSQKSLDHTRSNKKLAKQGAFWLPWNCGNSATALLMLQGVLPGSKLAGFVRARNFLRGLTFLENERCDQPTT